ncbi:MAG TPA: ATP-binding protein [Tepidisphaeraceae bacterium]|nr:ATP-binding protein [Tepidisphaeraceae bacterium]
MRGNTNRLALIFMAVAAITLGSTMVIYWMGQQVNTATQAAIRSRDLLAALEDTLATLISAETGQRGYLLTGDGQYLEPYHVALDRIPKDLAELDDAAKAGETSAQQVQIVARLTQERLAQLEQTIQLRREKGLEAALPIARENTAKRIMEELRERIGQMEAQANITLTVNRQRRDNANTMRTVVAAGMALITLLFLGWAYRRIRHGIRVVEQAVEALRRYELLASHSRDIILFLNYADGRILEANAAAVNAYGYSREQMLTMTIHNIAVAQAPGVIAERMAKADAQGILFETFHRRKDGSTFPVEVSARGATVNGRRTLISVVRDITERKAAEQALRENREDLNRAQAVAHTGSWRLLVPHNRLLWSDETYRIFGIPQGTPLSYEVFIAAVHPEDRDHLDRKWQDALHGEPYDVEHRILVKGTVKWVRERAELEFDSQGVLQGGFGTVQDITAQKRAEEELQAAKQSAERANAAKDHFLAILSHELRTPLTPVVAGISMLQDNPLLDEPTRESLDLIRRNVELEARLIDDLLDLTRIVRGKVELHKQDIELCAVVRRAVEVCKSDLEARGLHFAMDLAPAASCHVRADAARLQQVFWNLLKNAIKFTPPGGCVGIRCRPEGQTVVTEVIDSGIGIEPEVLPRLFNAFEQAERSITRKFGGLGLGLAISKAMLEQHGGTIEASSPGKGKGATFRVRLPVLPTRPALHPATGDGQVSGEKKQRPSPHPLRILLVEDHVDTAKIMRLLLMADGHEVQTAGDVATALNLAEQHPFDLLISDLGLPDASGHDLMSQLRSRGRSLPGIALSGYGQEQDIQRSREAGFSAHLIKPTNPAQLLQTIAAVTGHAPAPAH